MIRFCPPVEQRRAREAAAGHFTINAERCGVVFEKDKLHHECDMTRGHTGAHDICE